jgi:hypothetical protein
VSIIELKRNLALSPRNELYALKNGGKAIYKVAMGNTSFALFYGLVIANERAWCRLVLREELDMLVWDVLSEIGLDMLDLDWKSYEDAMQGLVNREKENV